MAHYSSIERFKGTNFEQWRCRVQLVLQAEKVWAVTNGTSVRPPVANEQRHTREELALLTPWLDEDIKARSLIVCMIADSHLPQVASLTSAKAMWDALWARYQ